MFKNPFSFKGRISRTEYIISSFTSLISLFITISYSDNFIHGDLFTLYMLGTYIWLKYSQGTKRCHDLNHNGFYQLIPFFVFALIFGEPVNYNNNYGEDPRSFSKKKYNLLLFKFSNINFSLLLQTILPFALLNSLLIALLINLLEKGFVLNLLIFLSISISYLILLFFQMNTYRTKWAFSLLLFLIMKIYSTFFLNYPFSWINLPIEIILIFIPFGLSFISDYVYNLYPKKTIASSKTILNKISVALILVFVLFAINNGYKDNITWRKNILTWNDFKEVNDINGEYAADILSSIKTQGDFNDSDFKIYAFMNPNESHRLHDSLVDNQVLIHETYHFNITEYHARLLRKHVIEIGKENLTKKTLDSLLLAQLKALNKMQDEYDDETIMLFMKNRSIGSEK